MFNIIAYTDSNFSVKNLNQSKHYELECSWRVRKKATVVSTRERPWTGSRKRKIMPEHCVLLRLKLSHRKLFLAWKAAPARRRRGAHTSRVCGDASVATAPSTGVYMLAAVHYGWLGRYIERMYALLV